MASEASGGGTSLVPPKQKLPDDRVGSTICFKILARYNEQADGKAEIREITGYLTLNLNPDGKTLREVFVRMGKPGSQEAFGDAWAQQVSKRLQAGVSVDEVFWPDVRSHFEPYGDVLGVAGIRSCTSVPDLIARIAIKRFGTREVP